jgi:flagellar hook-length control protein FliK
VPVAFDVTRDPGALGAATTAASSALPNEDGVSTSIVQALRLQVTAGGGSATITLDPSYLGGVRVAVQVADGAVTATLHAANPQVRAWMEANESTLRQALLDHGLTLDRLIVADRHGADLQRDPNPQRHARRSAAAAAPPRHRAVSR